MKKKNRTSCQGQKANGNQVYSTPHGMLHILLSKSNLLPNGYMSHAFLEKLAIHLEKKMSKLEKVKKKKKKSSNMAMKIACLYSSLILTQNQNKI